MLHKQLQTVLLTHPRFVILTRYVKLYASPAPRGTFCNVLKRFQSKHADLLLLEARDSTEQCYLSADCQLYCNILRHATQLESLCCGTGSPGTAGPAYNTSKTEDALVARE